jgi:DNA-binding LacI/PurR family transcriptional regulator
LYAGPGWVDVRMPFAVQILGGLQRGCEIASKDLLLRRYPGEDSSEDILTELRDGRIDGLIVVMKCGEPLARQLAESRFPAITMADPAPGLPAVCVDDDGGSRLLAHHLHEKGHRTCLYVGVGQQPISGARRAEAFLDEARNVGIKTSYLYQPCGPHSFDETMDYWLATPSASRPSAVAFWHDYSAFEFLARCHPHGIKVPDDVAVVGFDGCPKFCDFHDNLTLTTILAPWALVAQTAVENLNKIICGQQVPRETTLSVELVTGNTT